MRFYVGVTDTEWYRFLSTHKTEDVNFWQPGGARQFGAVEKGAPFLFRLKSPHNAIGGLGFFSAAAIQPLAAAWEFFGIANGHSSYAEFRRVISAYKQKAGKTDLGALEIGCVILSDPIFFDEADWIREVPAWSPSIVQGKGYDDTEPSGAWLWDQVRLRLLKYRFYERVEDKPSALSLENPEERYRETVARVRVGQGAFRLLVANAYDRACAITGEHTLPVLEAAHIKPYAESGPHLVSNGLLLRSDLHKLYDSGYLTVMPELRVEVSPRIKEEFNNGKIYYAMHGQNLAALPRRFSELPDPAYLSWHNVNVFKAG
ncbi:MAG: HNH endonuclease [Spirochaetales bacterium]|nr:HNH endonuclease [Spirochaetales bacterium]